MIADAAGGRRSVVGSVSPVAVQRTCAYPALPPPVKVPLVVLPRHACPYLPGRVAEDRAALEPWARRWRDRVTQQFTDAYLDNLNAPGLLPDDRDDLETLLRILLLERALDDVGRDLARRPTWVVIPIRAILRELEGVEVATS